ncbi:hypothetical protein [Pseudomonas aeruginosa]|uniref:hypothetical protein n=1 Tax=Pseudomonas aeruginosa TaxID=287 RepID=UPI002A6A1D54|nr:hypothetical protein [Pseudomonas aeruginosa]MDY1143444.1 hypothetical protein [Pseudomonas aeruginosa]MDY1207714.1 hypothetical protein [Pseudomonas aeruginosa]
MPTIQVASVEGPAPAEVFETFWFPLDGDLFLFALTQMHGNTGVAVTEYLSGLRAVYRLLDERGDEIDPREHAPHSLCVMGGYALRHLAAVHGEVKIKAAILEGQRGGALNELNF